MKKKFSGRGFISLTVFWSFIIESVTGVVLYIIPTGRISRWTNWELLGLDHSGWVELHIIFGYVFLIFAVIHIINNWKPICFYIKRKVQAGMKIRKELLASLILCSVLTAGTLLNMAPFQAVIDLGESIKKTWPGGESTPIASHSERMTFAEFSKESGIDLHTALDKMETAGYYVGDSEILIAELTQKYGLAPIEIHEIITECVNENE